MPGNGLYFKLQSSCEESHRGMCVWVSAACHRARTCVCERRRECAWLGPEWWVELASHVYRKQVEPILENHAPKTNTIQVGAPPPVQLRRRPLHESVSRLHAGVAPERRWKQGRPWLRQRVEERVASQSVEVVECGNHGAVEPAAALSRGCKSRQGRSERRRGHRSNHRVVHRAPMHPGRPQRPRGVAPHTLALLHRRRDSTKDEKEGAP